MAARNKTGKGGFGDNPQNRHRDGSRSARVAQFSRNLRELLVSEGEASAGTLPDGTVVSKVEALAKVIWQDALKGDNWCRNFIAERVEGRITQPVSGEGGGPLEVVIREIVKDADREY